MLASSQPTEGIPHAHHHRSRPRRLCRVGELGGVIEPLVAEGHRVVAAPNPLRGLAADAASVSDIVRTIEGPVVLVAHSYGGAVSSNVDRDAGEIVGLV
jgi:pimeloyl-ACP methyl ester carboxylesterase